MLGEAFRIVYLTKQPTQWCCLCQTGMCCSLQAGMGGGPEPVVLWRFVCLRLALWSSCSSSTHLKFLLPPIRARPCSWCATSSRYPAQTFAGPSRGPDQATNPFFKTCPCLPVIILFLFWAGSLMRCPAHVFIPVQLRGSVPGPDSRHRQAGGCVLGGIGHKSTQKQSCCWAARCC